MRTIAQSIRHALLGHRQSTDAAEGQVILLRDPSHRSGDLVEKEEVVRMERDVMMSLRHCRFSPEPLIGSLAGTCRPRPNVPQNDGSRYAARLPRLTPFDDFRVLHVPFGLSRAVKVRPLGFAANVLP